MRRALALKANNTQKAAGARATVQGFPAAVARALVGLMLLGQLGGVVPPLMPPAKAQDASQCGFIQNADRRNLCRARAKREASECGFIQNSDLRNYCRAEIKGARSECGFIRDTDLRAECYAMLPRP